MKLQKIDARETKDQTPNPWRRLGSPYALEFKQRLVAKVIRAF